MVKSTVKLTSRTYLFIIAGLAFFIIYLYFFVDIPKMLVLISQTDLFFYGLAAASTVGGVMLSAITWQRSRIFARDVSCYRMAE